MASDLMLSRHSVCGRFPVRRKPSISGTRVNGRKVSAPSQLVKAGDVIAPRQKAGTKKIMEQVRDAVKGRPIPSWLEVSEEPLSARVLALPNREEVEIPIREQLVVELCSK